MAFEARSENRSGKWHFFVLKWGLKYWQVNWVLKIEERDTASLGPLIFNFCLRAYCKTAEYLWFCTDIPT